jgi:hypothetical protein
MDEKESSRKDYGQTLEVNKDVANQGQDGLMG